MTERYVDNQLLQDIVFDLSRVFNLDFKQDLLTEQEISAESRRVAGMLIQPVVGNTSQYQVASGYFEQKGASPQSAGTLALIVSNISKLTGSNVNSIIRRLENSDISFTDEVFKQINHLRTPQSQWFRFQETLNERRYHFIELDDCFCAAPQNLQINCTVAPVTNFIIAYVSDAFGSLSYFPFQTTVIHDVVETLECPTEFIMSEYALLSEYTTDDIDSISFTDSTGGVSLFTEFRFEASGIFLFNADVAGNEDSVFYEWYTPPSSPVPAEYEIRWELLDGPVSSVPEQPVSEIWQTFADIGDFSLAWSESTGQNITFRVDIRRVGVPECEVSKIIEVALLFDSEET